MSFKPPVEGSWSPWGEIDGVTELARGVWNVSTPGHGGIRLSPSRNRRVHRIWRGYGGWYEEDCAWSIPFLTFCNELCGDDKETFEAAYKMAMDTWPLETHLALGQWFDDRQCVKFDLLPGTQVRWVAKVNSDHLPEGDPWRVYACFNDRGEETFIDNREFPAFGPDGVYGVVIGRPKWSGTNKQLHYPVSHAEGVSNVSRSYLERIEQ